MGEETVFDHAAWLERENRRLNDSLNVVVVQRNEARAALADARDRLDAVDAQRIALEVALESERTALAAANARADAEAHEREMAVAACADWSGRWDAMAADLAAARRECDEQREAKEAAYSRMYKLRDALERCSELFSSIRGDWTDPRSECREGQDVIRAALAAPGDAGDPVIEEVPPHLCGGNNCEECGGPGAEHADTCSCKAAPGDGEDQPSEIPDGVHSLMEDE